MNAKSDNAKNKSDEKDPIIPRKVKKKRWKKNNKANNSPNKIESKDAKLKTTKRKKICVEILRDSMLNDIQEKGLNKNADTNIKIWKYPGASSDHIKPSFRKEPNEILIYEGKNELTTNKQTT